MDAAFMAVLKTAFNEEFSLGSQAKVRATSDEVTGFEALLRWNTVVNKQIGPQEFIPIAEKSGLIRDIGSWVLQATEIFIH